MNSLTTRSIGLVCALGLSLSACGKKETSQAKPEPEAAKPASEPAKTPPKPTEPAKPEPPVASDPAPKAAPLQLSSKDMGKDFEKSLEDGKISTFGAEHVAKDHCNESTILNPATVEVFETGTVDQLVVLCPGSLDGETNVVTLFAKGQEPRSKSVSPPDSSHRIEDVTLTSTVQALLDSK